MLLFFLIALQRPAVNEATHTMKETSRGTRFRQTRAGRSWITERAAAQIYYVREDSKMSGMKVIFDTHYI